MEQSPEKIEDTRIYFQEDIREAAKAYAAAERDRMDNPLIKELITWKSIIQQIVRNDLQKHGYYKPLPRQKAEVAAERGE